MLNVIAKCILLSTRLFCKCNTSRYFVQFLSLFMFFYCLSFFTEGNKYIIHEKQMQIPSPTVAPVDKQKVQPHKMYFKRGLWFSLYNKPDLSTRTTTNQKNPKTYHTFELWNGIQRKVGNHYLRWKLNGCSLIVVVEEIFRSTFKISFK